MKKIILSLAIALSGYCAYAQTQWTTSGSTIYYNSGNVGIGNNLPNSLLTIGSASTRGTVNIIGSTTDIGTLNFTDSRSGGHQYSLYNGLSALGNIDIFDQTTSAYRFTLTANGSAGIGTTNPDRKLTVAGQIGITGNAVGLVFKNTNASNKLWDITPYGNDLVFSESGIASLLTLKSGGNVGIGTTAPTTKLSLVTNTGTAPISIQTGLGGAWQLGQNVGGGSGDDTFGLYSYTYGPTHGYYPLIQFNSSTGNTFLNQAGGNVLIGQTTQGNPAYKLDINGSARANAIVVNTTGADFVFEDKYPLKKLSEVKEYINKNHHLPEIQSAKEMQTNGVDLGELNTKLLQKVEELTLYMIELQKQNIDLKKELTKTKKRNHLK